MTKLYDMPFEKRIRHKYLYFGMILGMTGFNGLMFTSGLTSYLIRVYVYAVPIETNYEQWILNQTTLYGIFLFLIPLLYFMWYSKAKPKNHQELNETIGLKDDWDKVNKI